MGLKETFHAASSTSDRPIAAEALCCIQDLEAMLSGSSTDEQKTLKLPLLGKILIHKRLGPSTNDQVDNKANETDGKRATEEFSMDWMNDEELAQCEEFLNDDMWEFDTELLA